MGGKVLGGYFFFIKIDELISDSHKLLKKRNVEMLKVEENRYKMAWNMKNFPLASRKIMK